MAKKRITLPDNFKALLESGDVEALQKVFTTCDINAKWGRYGSNAFALAPLPPAFAVWLKEQGADVNRQDHYGNTPIFTHAGAAKGDVRLLLELGAQPNLWARGVTPLHLAAAHGRIDAIKALIETGVDVDACAKTPMGESGTPLEHALTQARIPLALMVQVCTLLLEGGAQTTAKVPKAVENLGDGFEFAKAGITDMQFRAEQAAALVKLYNMFGVTPVKALEVHDGVSPIHVQEQGVAAQFNKLWEYLVPPSGPAKTGQGEAIRIAGRVAHEVMDNGGMNWDGDYRQMLDALLQYLKCGNALAPTDLALAQRLVKAIYNGKGMQEPEQLMDLTVKWVLQNPPVLPVLPRPYKR